MIEDDIEQLRQDIALALESDDQFEIERILSDVSPADTAMLLDSMPAQLRDALWPLVQPEELGEVLLETQDDVSDARLRDLEPAEITAIIEAMSDVAGDENAVEFVASG